MLSKVTSFFILQSFVVSCCASSRMKMTSMTRKLPLPQSPSIKQRLKLLVITQRRNMYSGNLQAVISNYYNVTYGMLSKQPHIKSITEIKLVIVGIHLIMYFVYGILC